MQLLPCCLISTTQPCTIRLGCVLNIPFLFCQCAHPDVLPIVFVGVLRDDVLPIISVGMLRDADILNGTELMLQTLLAASLIL